MTAKQPDTKQPDALSGSESGSEPESVLVPLWQNEWEARWMVSQAAEVDPDNYHSGWVNVDGNAHTGLVEVECGGEFTAAEARNLAAALNQAADHCEQYGHTMSRILFDLTCPGGLPEIGRLPREQQAAFRDVLRAAGRRYEHQQHKPTTTSNISITAITLASDGGTQ